MKIDLHVHTSERSGCATVNEEGQIRAAIEKGLDGIAITDHDRLVPADHLVELNAQYAPFKIFTGIEVSSDDLHWVVIGINDTSLESMAWHYPDLLAFVRSRGGFIFLAHPFRYQPELEVDVYAYPPDGVEIETINTPVQRKDDIRALADRLGLTLMHNSDGHYPGGVGRYVNVLPRPARDDRELVSVLLSMQQPVSAAQSTD